MARMVVIYRTPRDTAAFDKHYFDVHIPIVKKVPGLRKYEVSRGPIDTPAGPSDFYLVSTLYFDDLAAIKSALASPEGQVAAADAKAFSNDRAYMLLFDDREV